MCSHSLTFFPNSLMVVFYVKDKVSKARDGYEVAGLLKEKIGNKEGFFEFGMLKVEPYSKYLEELQYSVVLDRLHEFCATALYLVFALELVSDLYRAILLAWQLCKCIDTKESFCISKRVQIPQNWIVTPMWRSFCCFGTPIWPL